MQKGIAVSFRYALFFKQEFNFFICFGASCILAKMWRLAENIRFLIPVKKLACDAALYIIIKQR